MSDVHCVEVSVEASETKLSEPELCSEGDSVSGSLSNTSCVSCSFTCSIGSPIDWASCRRSVISDGPRRVTRRRVVTYPSRDCVALSREVLDWHGSHIDQYQNCGVSGCNSGFTEVADSITGHFC